MFCVTKSDSKLSSKEQINYSKSSTLKRPQTFHHSRQKLGTFSIVHPFRLVPSAGALRERTCWASLYLINDHNFNWLKFVHFLPTFPLLFRQSLFTRRRVNFSGDSSRRDPKSMETFASEHFYFAFACDKFDGIKISGKKYKFLFFCASMTKWFFKHCEDQRAAKVRTIISRQSQVMYTASCHHQ